MNFHFLLYFINILFGTVIGSLSLAKLGNQTKNSQGSPASSPTMVFSEEYKKEESDLAENDFIKSLCDKIQGEKPSECYKNGNTGNGQFFSHIALLPLITTFVSYLC